MDPPAFWIWHRSSTLNAAELESLKRAGVRSLFWQAAECRWDHGWRVNRIARPMAAAGLEITPVFRIQPEPAFLGNPGSAALLAETVREWSAGAGLPREVQLDFDCPDRLLGSYAKFLREFGGAIAPTTVSITALAAWPRHPDFGKLADSVSSLAPMFYDLEPEDPAEVRAGRVHPVAAPSSAPLIRLWKSCPRPWFAGLPNFERLSVFAADGKLNGHLRGWEHDSVFFHPSLTPRPGGEGVTWFDLENTVEISGTKVPVGATLVHRAPDAVVLTKLIDEADRAGARGILYFALPGPGIQAAFTSEHLSHPSAAAVPALSVGKNGSVVLANSGLVDLPARRWELELVSSTPGAFQSASPGGFAEMETPEGIPAEHATSLVLRFSKLPVGMQITSGAVIRNVEGITWRIRDLNVSQALVKTR